MKIANTKNSDFSEMCEYFLCQMLLTYLPGYCQVQRCMYLVQETKLSLG